MKGKYDRTIMLMYIFTPLFFSLMWLFSAVTDGEWTFGGKTLSNLGISTNPLSAFLFNAGCFFTGLMISISGYLRILNKEWKFVGIAFILQGFFLLLIGVFNLSIYEVHCAVADTFGVFSFIILVGFLYFRIKDKKYIPAAVAVVPGIITLIVFLTQPFALAEAVMIIFVMILFEIMGFEKLIAMNKPN